MSEKTLPDAQDAELQQLREQLDEERRRNSELQTELDDSRRVLDTLFARSPDFYVLKDIGSVYRRVNPAFCRFLGKREDEIIGRSDFDLFEPEDARMHVSRDAEVVRTRKQLSGDWSIVGPKGRSWFRVLKTPLFDSSGEVGAILCMVTDVSRSIKAEMDFDRIFNLMPDMVCVASAEDRFIKVNNVWQQTLGYTEEELLSVPFTELIHPDDLQATLDEIGNKRAGGGTLNFINRYRARDGSYHWLEWNSTPFESGMLYAVARDITQRIEQERQTHLWADAFRFCAHGIAIGIPETNVVLNCNEAFARISGRRVCEIEGSPILNLYVPEDRALVREMIMLADSSGFASYQARMLRIDGTAFPVQMDVVCVHDEAGKPVYRIATMQDITERMESQSALRESEERFRSVVESAPDAIFIQTDGFFEYLNHRALTLFGATALSEMVGRRVIDMIHPDHRAQVAERIHQLNEIQQSVPALEEQILRLDGTAVDVEASAVPFFFAGHHGALVFLRDISRRKQSEKDRAELELQLFQSQKIESIGRLAGGIAHDLNNLLTPILGYSEMLVKRFTEPGRNRQNAEVIHHAALKSRDLVRQLLAFSSRQALEFRMIDLNAVIRDFEQLLRRTIRADIDIRYHLHGGRLVIQGDAGQLEQIIMNLAVNAEDAMPSGGTLIMETCPMVIEKGRERYFEGLPAGSYVVLTVRDTGIGMDKQTLSHIFEPFFTTKPKGKGTGLGLSTVYGIVRQHGGIIQVESDSGSGTSFRISLPLQSCDIQQMPNGDETVDDLEGAARVLVVEDDEMVRNFVVQTLLEAGFVIRDTESGEQALELLRQDGFVPDLLLTDLVMRGMNGRILYEKVSQLIPAIKVIYMSGYTKDIISSHGVLQEGLVYLQKPFAVPVLLAKVREILQNGKGGGKSSGR